MGQLLREGRDMARRNASPVPTWLQLFPGVYPRKMGRFSGIRSGAVRIPSPASSVGLVDRDVDGGAAGNRRARRW